MLKAEKRKYIYKPFPDVELDYQEYMEKYGASADGPLHYHWREEFLDRLNMEDKSQSQIIKKLRKKYLKDHMERFVIDLEDPENLTKNLKNLLADIVKVL